jgi:hypothetical protein
VAEREDLLCTRDVAELVARGLLRFDAQVSDALNDRFMCE